jgi:hypothetical protein
LMTPSEERLGLAAPCRACKNLLVDHFDHLRGSQVSPFTHEESGGHREDDESERSRDSPERNATASSSANLPVPTLENWSSRFCNAVFNLSHRRCMHMARPCAYISRQTGAVVCPDLVSPLMVGNDDAHWYVRNQHSCPSAHHEYACYGGVSWPPQTCSSTDRFRDSVSVADHTRTSMW